MNVTVKSAGCINAERLMKLHEAAVRDCLPARPEGSTPPRDSALAGTADLLSAQMAGETGVSPDEGVAAKGSRSRGRCMSPEATQCPTVTGGIKGRQSLPPEPVRSSPAWTQDETDYCIVLARYDLPFSVVASEVNLRFHDGRNVRSKSGCIGRVFRIAPSGALPVTVPRVPAEVRAKARTVPRNVPQSTFQARRWNAGGVTNRQDAEKPEVVAGLAKNRRIAAIRSAALALRERQVAVSNSAKLLIELEPRECRWPLTGDASKGTLLFCAAEVEQDKSSYCNKCRKLAYVPASKRKGAFRVADSMYATKAHEDPNELDRLVA